MTLTSPPSFPPQSVVSAIAPRHILAADNAAGHALVALAESNEAMQHAWRAAAAAASSARGNGDKAAASGGASEGGGGGSGGLRVTWVPDQLCANVLRIGKHVVMQRGGYRSRSV